MSGSGFLFSPINGGSPFAHLGAAADVAYHPQAPQDEVEDAGREVVKAYGEPNANSADLMGMMDQWVQLQRAEQMAGRMVAKALTTSTPSSDDPMARTAPLLNSMGGGTGAGRYIPKQGLPFVALKQLGKRIEVTQAITRTITRKVMAFAEPSQNDDLPGWRLEAMDPKAVLGEDHIAYLHWLTQFLVCGGREFDALQRRKRGREGYSSFLRKLVPDSLNLDHGVVELVPLRGANGLDSFFMRDSSTFFLANTEVTPDAGKDPFFLVQEVNPGGIIEFTHEQAALFQRNPQTDLEWCGYGLSELESCIETISNFLQAMAYTREGIDNNAIPRGILVMSGAYDPAQSQAFQAAWQAKVRGAQNAFGLPVMFSRGQTAAANFIQTGAPFSEMAFAKWISLQSAIGCSIYGIDPAEIGMESFSDGKAGALGGGEDTSERLAAAKDKGFRPLMQDISGFTTQDILSRFAPWIRMRFTGLNPGDEKFKASERARLSTINEARQALGMPKHPVDSIGALPADAGILAAEFSRYQTILTLDEARAAWGGLKPYPNAQVGMTPLNPSLQAAVQGALSPQPDPSETGPGGNEEGAEGDDPAQDGPEAPGADSAKPEGFGADVSDRLHSLSGASSEE